MDCEKKPEENLLALYRRSGLNRCPPTGGYEPNELLSPQARLHPAIHFNILLQKNFVAGYFMNLISMQLANL